MLTQVLAFCIGLIAWVIIMLPETKGVGIEEMDKLFGGNQGEADIIRMRDIRRRLGLGFEDMSGSKEIHPEVSQIEKV